LHHVQDLWVERWRRLDLADPHRFPAELKQRLEPFALELIRTRPGSSSSGGSPSRTARPEEPDTFAFLGFTHIFGRTRQGRRLIRRIPCANG